MTARLSSKPLMGTWDCLHCGETYWYREDDPPSCICGDALVKRIHDFKPDFWELCGDNLPSDAELEHVEDRLLGGWQCLTEPKRLW